jgi:hypothetical protein
MKPLLVLDVARLTHHDKAVLAVDGFDVGCSLQLALAFLRCWRRDLGR